MKEANVTNVKLGDKVVPKNEEYRQNLLRHCGAVYGRIDRLQQAGRSPIVSWINHKGMVTRPEWFMLKKYAELYEDVPRET